MCGGFLGLWKLWFIFDDKLDMWELFIYGMIKIWFLFFVNEVKFKRLFVVLFNCL